MRKALYGLGFLVVCGLGVVGFDYSMQAKASPVGLSVGEYFGGFGDRRAEARAMKAVDALTLEDLAPRAPEGWTRARFDKVSDPSDVAGMRVQIGLGPSPLDWNPDISKVLPASLSGEGRPKRRAFTYRSGEAIVFFAVAHFPGDSMPPAPDRGASAPSPAASGPAVFAELAGMLDRHTPGATLVAAASLGTPQPWAILGGVEFWPATPNPYPTMAAYEARIGNYLVTVASPSGPEALVAILAQFDVGTVNLKLDTPMDGVAPSAFYIDALAGLY